VTAQVHIGVVAVVVGRTAVGPQPPPSGCPQGREHLQQHHARDQIERQPQIRPETGAHVSAVVPDEAGHAQEAGSDGHAFGRLADGVEGGGRADVAAGMAEVAGAAEEVDVFVVEEVGGIEAAELLEDIAAEEQERAGDPIARERIGEIAVEHQERRHVGVLRGGCCLPIAPVQQRVALDRERARGAFARAAPIDERRTGGPVAVRGDRGAQRFDRPIVAHRIGIDDRQQRRRRVGHAAVDAAREADVLRHRDGAQPPVADARNARERVIARRVVDHHHLRDRGRGQQAVKARLDRRCAVEGDDDRGHRERLGVVCGHCFRADRCAPHRTLIGVACRPSSFRRPASFSAAR
jgi:hypothetical protein